MTRALLQQSLDALESVLKAHRLDDRDASNRSTIIHAVSQAEKAIAALQAAIDAPESEPVGIFTLQGGEYVQMGFGYKSHIAIPLYDRPEPAKPLTDERISEISTLVYLHNKGSDNQFARAIEAAHGIREVKP